MIGKNSLEMKIFSVLKVGRPNLKIDFRRSVEVDQNMAERFKVPVEKIERAFVNMERMGILYHGRGEY